MKSNKYSSIKRRASNCTQSIGSAKSATPERCSHSMIEASQREIGTSSFKIIKRKTSTYIALWSVKNNKHSVKSSIWSTYWITMRCSVSLLMILTNPFLPYAFKEEIYAYTLLITYKIRSYIEFKELTPSWNQFSIRLTVKIPKTTKDTKKLKNSFKIKRPWETKSYCRRFTKTL